MITLKIRNIIVFTLLVVTLGSCDPNRVFQEFKKIDNYIWHADEMIEFAFESKDTVSVHNIYINIRHANNYPFSNLWLFITSTAPNGQSVVDTVQCVFADKNGKWMGDGSGDLWDNKILWKQFVKFPLQGTYSIKYQHGMRPEFLPGILDVGLRIENVEPLK